jgi:hypothetical protein
MPIAKITGQGLGAIALSVGLLWGCLIGERVLRQRASADEIRSRQQIELLQRGRHQPVASPLPQRPHHVRSVAA